jgi:N-acetylmuramoyl-L-alanine amidase
MSRQSVLVAGFLNQIVLAMIFANGAYALNAGETNSILSCVENDRASQIILTTKRRAPISAPMVSYLPGEDGEIIMTADFDGLAYTLPTRIIRIGDDSVRQRQRGIREIRIGQLQASPPVCRVSVVTSDMRALKALNFNTSAGTLVIRWAPETTASIASNLSNLSNRANRANLDNSSTRDPNKYQTSSVTPPLAPSFKNRRAVTSGPTSNYSYSQNNDSSQSANMAGASGRYQQTGKPVLGRADGSGITSYGNQTESINAQPISRKIPNGSEISTWSSADLLSRPVNKKKRSAAPIDASGDAIAHGAEAKPADSLLGEYPEERKSPVISLTMDRDPGITDQTAAVFRLKIQSEHSLTYNTFRLNNPERYVIDFTNCPELIDAQLPDVQGSEFIRSVRVGQLDDPTKTRLVIDLINEPVTIKEQVQREANLLTIRLSRAIEAADSAASQVQVPTGTTIVLDAGHGGSDPGAQRGDVQEKEITLGIIEQLKKRLEARGFRITLTRADDTFVSLEDRVRITNALQPTLFLSVHINAMESANDIHGIETYYQTEQSRALADAIHENLVTKLDAPDRAVRKARFYVINHTPVPAVLAEVGFISNRDERDKLISSDYRIKVANALEQGVMLYLDKKLARGQIDPSRTLETTDNNRSQSGTMQLSGKSHNTSIAQRKKQFEDQTR